MYAGSLSVSFGLVNIMFVANLLEIDSEIVSQRVIHTVVKEIKLFLTQVSPNRKLPQESLNFLSLYFLNTLHLFSIASVRDLKQLQFNKHVYIYIQTNI